ncbi:MAG: helix-turn-helix domain-containing protein [Verrucomicrobiales bacterium]
MAIQQNSKQKVSDLVTRKAAASRLSISTRTLDRMANKGLIEKVFVGGSVRFRSYDIDKIVSEGV